MVSFDPRQMALNQAFGNQLAEQNIATKPKWMRDLYHANQSFASAMGPIITLASFASIGSASRSVAAQSAVGVTLGTESSVLRAGTVSQAAAPVNLYRHVSAAELADIQKTGNFNTGSNSMMGKWFAESSADASQWGQLMDNGSGVVVRTTVPRNFFDDMMSNPNLDGIGPARYTDNLVGLNHVKGPVRVQ